MNFAAVGLDLLDDLVLGSAALPTAEAGDLLHR